MKLKPIVSKLLLIIGVLILGFYYAWYVNDLKERREVYTQPDISSLVNLTNDDIELYNHDLDVIRTTDVYFTNYHLGDGSSGTTTASGLQIKDFEVNEDDMYTYDGKVVVATANMTRLPRGIVEGYKSHELYEEFTIRLNGNEYIGVVLDVCGKCYYAEGEFLQRYDIFTTGNVIGKVIGQVVLEGKR